MKIRVTSKLNLNARWLGLISQADIRVTPRGRLLAKLLVFSTQAALQSYWKKHLGGTLGRGCLGAVNALRTHCIDYQNGEERERWEVDARYFCVIGLCRRHLTCRVIAHECVHAGFAYAERKTRAPWEHLVADNSEEAVAYPVGEIMRNVVNHLIDAGLLLVCTTESQ